MHMAFSRDAKRTNMYTRMTWRRSGAKVASSCPNRRAPPATIAKQLPKARSAKLQSAAVTSSTWKPYSSLRAMMTSTSGRMKPSTATDPQTAAVKTRCGVFVSASEPSRPEEAASGRRGVLGERRSSKSPSWRPRFFLRLLPPATALSARRSNRGNTRPESKSKAASAKERSKLLIGPQLRLCSTDKDATMKRDWSLQAWYGGKAQAEKCRFVLS
mmetsp:Transcript_86213/g.184805  ORF Transcript_86213/g.184805 Transcript_86213/m.184805 type:complete len:215 (-) Transcript_86213:98-742(-)